MSEDLETDIVEMKKELREWESEWLSEWVSEWVSGWVGELVSKSKINLESESE